MFSRDGMFFLNIFYLWLVESWIQKANCLFSISGVESLCAL
jgi:hypothetical protein